MIEKLFYASEFINDIKIDIIASAAGIRKILLNKNFITDNGIEKVSSDDPIVADAFNQLKEYFNRKRKSFDLQLEIIGTDFQKKVWNELIKIPYGETISYNQLAIKLGDQKSIRAAASANGANPLPIVVPCHRVIGSDGSLVGYGGGLDVKKKLLELEGNWSLDLFANNEKKVY
jgi:methylated-DNA-[protein]-cysteine S-methyltransferase